MPEEDTRLVVEIVDELASRDALLSMMSGSGSTVFGIFSEPPDAAEIVRSTGCETLVTQTSIAVVRVEIDR